MSKQNKMIDSISVGSESFYFALTLLGRLRFSLMLIGLFQVTVNTDTDKPNTTDFKLKVEVKSSLVDGQFEMTLEQTYKLT